MFTGIIEELGVVKNVERRNNLLRLGIAVSFAAGVNPALANREISVSKGGVKIGDSIAVNGVCLTVVKIESNILFFEAVSGTLDTTDIAGLRPNDKVNMEQALKAGDRLGGHIVAGHIDTVGYIRRKETDVFDITIGEKFISNVVEKGSVAIDGISLTVARLGKDFITVNIIPHTLKETTLGFKKQGDSVNVEFDIIGKYSIRKPSSVITENFLREHGFLS